MKNDFDNHSFRDFEYVPRIDAWARASKFKSYCDDQTAKEQLNYRLIATNSCGSWIEILHVNMKCFRYGLLSLGLDIGDTSSAIFPVRFGNKIKNAKICQGLSQKRVCSTKINYPAMSLNDAPIRMGITALHVRAHLDKVLNFWADIKNEFSL